MRYAAIPEPARQVVLPYFDVALRGGGMVVAKRVGRVVLNFPAGSVHAWTRSQATVRVNRAAATLPARRAPDPDPSAQAG